MTLSWTTPADNPVSFNGYYEASGIKGYKIYDNNNDLTPGSNVTGNSKQIVLRGEGQHVITITPYDNEDNAGVSATKLVRLDQSGPTGNVSINGNSLYTNNRSVTINLSDIMDSDSGISQIRFSEDDLAYSDWEPCEPGSLTKAYTMISPGDGLKMVYVQLKDNVCNITTKSAEITLDTTPPIGNIGINNNQTVTDSPNVSLQVTATDLLSGVTEMQFSNDGANFSAWEPYSNDPKTWQLAAGDGHKTVYIRLKDKAGNVSDHPISATIYLDDAPPTGSIAINNDEAYTNQDKVTLNLAADDGDGIGVSQMQFSNDGTDFSAWEPYTTQKQWTIPSVEGNETVYVQYQDSYGHTAAFNDSIILDTTAPRGSFEVVSRDQKQIFDNATNPTNTKDVSIRVTGYNDDLGPAGSNSGVKGIYFWNGNSVTPPEDALYRSAADLAKNSNIDWTLTGGPDGERTVSMLVVDNAGNTNLVTYTVKLDTSPAGSPIAFKHSFGNNGIIFSWKADLPNDDLIKFIGSYTLPDQTTKTFEVTPSDTKEGSYEVPISGLSANQPVMFSVSSVDQAGNRSSEATYTAYSPAKLGSLQFQGVTYDFTTGRHQMHWQLTENPGEAKNQVLEYGNNTASGFTALGFLTPDTSGAFIHDTLADGSKLQPHATYHYRLVVYNNSGDPVYGEAFDQQVSNIRPTAPVLISPLRFARGEVSFQYQKSVDYDGDPNLTYQIYLGEGTDSNSCTALSTDTAANLVNGQTYTWYVKVDDGQGGTTKSESAQFTVDTTPPVISISELGRPYTNQTQLTVTVGDDRSGIDKINYKKTAITGEVEEGSLNLTAGAYGTQTAIYELTEGSYNLQFTVWDQAGNSTELQVNNCWVDRTIPELGNLQLGLVNAGSRYLASKLQIPASFDGRDNFAGLKGLQYWLLKDRNETLGTGTLIPLSNAMQHFAYGLDLQAEQGKEYYLAFALEDRAGNRSQVQVIGPVYFDLTPPQATVVLDNLSRYGAGSYLAQLENLTVNITAVDPETDIDQTKTQFAVIASDIGNPVLGWGIWDSVKQAVLTPGVKYRVAVRAVNGAGLTTEAVSEEFTYDNTALQNLTLTGGSDTVMSGELMVFTAGASEPESAITAYRLAIVAQDNPEAVLTAGIPGSDPDGWVTIHTGNSSAEFRIELPEALDGVYYPKIEAINAAGLKSSVSGESFVLSNTQEKVMVGDQGPYSLFDDHLTAWWKYRGPQSPTGYRYRIVDSANRTVYDWQTTTDTQATVSGLKLSSGMKYRFEVQASFEGGSFSAPGTSLGVTIDTTGPEITKLVIPEYATTTNLSLEWDGVDTESGIAKVQAALGSDYYQTDISGGWVELSGKSSRLSLDAAGYPLKLETGKHYYLTLRITNGAGSVTEMAAPGIMIDDTAPPTPVVYDQGGVINTSPIQTLDANWLWSPTDPESGIVRYQWAIMENGQNINDATWHDDDSTKRIALTMDDFPREHGKTYYFAVKATNGAGLSSIGYSNGIMVDATAPFIPQVKLLSATNSGDPNAPELNYITSTQDLALWIDSLDPESPIVNYQYAWGDPANLDSATRSDSPTDKIELQNPAIAEGVLTLFVSECVNQAELTSPSGYSSGVILDTGAPKITNVHGGVSGNQFLFDWDVIPSVSPVAYYEVALVKDTDINNIPASSSWTKVGLKRSITVDGKDLADGRYCLLIRAWNQAGTVSRRQDQIDEWGTSPVVMLDRTAPELSDLSYPKYAANLLEFQVAAKDDLSGVGGYQYALGSITNPTVYSGGWIDIDSGIGKLTFQVNTALYPHQAEVYLLIRAKDKVGLWSTTLASGKILIDHTAPTTPVVTGHAYSNMKTEITGITYTSTDPESGLTHYRLGVVAEKGGSWLATQLLPLSQFNGRLTGVNLVEGSVYYLAMQTQNGAGEWSDIGYSAPLTVDTIAPELRFTKASTPIVINQPPLELEYTLSEPAEVKFTLTGANGAAKQFEQDGIAGVNYFTFNETLPQVYTLSAQAIDPAGNPGTEQTQLIRINAPPQVALTALSGTPGKSLTYMATVTDPDGGEGDLLIYQWDPGDNTGLFTGPSPEHRYTKTGVYTLTLTVTDPDGGVTTVTATVTIGNTSGGTLYADEVWSGAHHITDTVTVPEGITLTILPGTEVIVDTATGGTGLNGLNIQGNLIVQGPVTFSSAIKSINTWLGITITGQATLDGLTVEYAERGLAVVGAQSVSVTRCTFKDNYVGIHVYSAQPVISECQLLDNLWYGIKEDEGGQPVVTGCTFQGNGKDYYDDTMTVISVEQLNQMAGNGGNK